MSWAIKLLPLAQADITEIIGWYDEKSKIIAVLAVLHGSRDPKVWKGRNA